MANPFNRFWSGLDFWDKDENKRQREQAAREDAQRKQQAAQQAKQSKPQVTLTQPTVQQNPVTNLMEQNKDKQPGEFTLQSFAPVEHKPEPETKIEKPQQGFWDKVRDIFDANTEADQYRRKVGNEQAIREGRKEDVKPVIEEDPGNLVSNTVGAIPRMANTLATQVPQVGFTLQNFFATKEQSAALEALQEAEKSGNKDAIALAKQRYEDAVNRVDDTNRNVEAANSMFGTHGGLFNAGTLYDAEDAERGDLATGLRKIGLGTAEGILDAASFGLTGVTGKEIAKEGFKQAMKNKAKTTAANAVINTTQGGVSAAREGGDWKDIALSSLISGTAGTALDIGLATTGGKLFKGKFADKTDIPDEIKVRVGISPELREAPDIDFNQKLTKVNDDALELGTDALDEVDQARVAEYKKKIEDGEPIDPLVVTKGDGGKVLVQDGKHRLLALRELGIKEAPVIYKTDKPQTIQVNGQTIDTTTGEVLNEGKAAADAKAQQIVDEGQAKQAAQVEDSKQPIAKQQEQAAQQADSGGTGLNLDGYMEALRQRADDFNNADEGTRAEMVANARPEQPDTAVDLLRAAGISDGDIVKLSEQFNATPAELHAVMNRVGDLSNAQNPMGVIVADLKKLRAGLNSKGEPDNALQAAQREGAKPTETAPVAPETPPAREVSTYENNINAIREEARQALEKIDDALKQNGSSFEQLARKIHEADRTGTPPQLTDIEARAYQVIRKELDDTLAAAQAAGRASEDVGRREFYLPQAKAGSVRVPETMDDLFDTGFGYDKARTGAIGLDELDYGHDPLIDYVVRGKANEQLVKQRIYDDIVTNHPDVTREAAEAATEIRAKAIDDINTQTVNPHADGSEIDTVGALKKEAEALGIQQTDDASKISKLSLNNEDRLKSIGQYERGFFQYRAAQALAQNIEEAGELPAFFREIGLEHLPEKRVEEITKRAEYLLENAGRYVEDATPEQLAAYHQGVIANAIRSAAKGNVEEVLRTTNFTDAATSKFMNKEFNDMAIGYNKAVDTVDKIGLRLRRLMNNSMRNLNVNSFLNEMSDVVNVLNIYGKDAGRLGNLNPRDMYEVNRRYGLARHLGLMDNPDQAEQVFSVLGGGSRKALNALFSAADTIDKKTALYSLAEQYKAAYFIKTAEGFYSSRGLSGTELTEKVLNDFYQNGLPLDHFSRVFTSDNQFVKLLTQYLDWNILNSRQQFRNAIGGQKAGRYADMGRGHAVGRNLALNIAPRLGLGMVRGVPFVVTMGVLDPLGALSPDYSGLQSKNPLDVAMKYAGLSPILSLGSQFYFNARQDAEANEMYDGKPPEDNRGDWLQRSLAAAGTMFTPFGGQIKRTSSMIDVLDKGYSENKNGKVQYLAPEDPLQQLWGLIGGKGVTIPAREYAGNPDLATFVHVNNDESPNNDLSVPEWFMTNPSVEALQQFLGQENVGDFERPLSDGKNSNYSDAVKNADSREEMKQLLQAGRDYNHVLDDFRKNNPDAYKAWAETFDTGNFVSPEYWRQITGGNADGDVDLATFKMMQARKQAAAKDLGVKYDPLYDLPDDQARAVLQQKSTATGDDIALRNILYKSQWYQDYMKKSSAYYNSLPETTDADEYKQTQRVKTWNGYNEQLAALSTMDDPKLAMQFPYTASYKAAQREYEKSHPDSQFFGSPESDAWYSKYGQGYKAEQEKVDAAKLELINQMRVIEGFPPMTADQYAQATEIADTDGGSGFGGGSGGGEYDFLPKFFNSFNAVQLPKVKSAEGVKFKPNTKVGRRKNPNVKIGAQSRGGGGYTV